MRIASFVVFTALALLLAPTAQAQAPLTRSTQVGAMQAHQLRAVGGDMDGAGYLWVEAYAGNALETSWHVTRVSVGTEEHTINELHNVVLGEARDEGFVFTATLGSEDLVCTALTWADSSAVCHRARMPAPLPTSACEAAFFSVGGRRQCETSFEIERAAGHDAEGILRSCVAAFRSEAHRNNCFLASHDPMWTRAFPVCAGTFTSDVERDFCIFFTVTEVSPARIDVSRVEQCTARAQGDGPILDCVFNEPTERATFERTRLLTNPMQSPASGTTDVETRTASWREYIATAHGGMIEGEPLLFFSVMASYAPGLHSRHGVDWLRIGSEVRAVREVTSLTLGAMSNTELRFRVMLDGRARRCVVGIGEHDARCR